MYNFILNPTAGKGKTVTNIEKIKKYLDGKNIKYRVFDTKYPFHATELAEKLSLEGCDNIIAVGGDGTVNEVLNGIKDFNCTLGIIPSGTGNDFSKSLNLPTNPIAAMDIIIENTPKASDYMLLNGKRVINVCGMGIDVAVIERCKKMKFFKGKFQYFISILAVLCRFDWYKISLSIDGGEEKKKSILIIAACNGRFLASGLRISPESDIADGYINLVIINETKRRKILGILIALLRGKLLKRPEVDNIRCRELCIKAEENAVNADGELYKNIPFVCKIVSNELKVFMK